MMDIILIVVVSITFCSFIFYRYFPYTIIDAISEHVQSNDLKDLEDFDNERGKSIIEGSKSSETIELFDPDIKICIFDIDSTINVSLENAKKAVETCKNHNAIIAINTARPGYFYQDLDLDAINLSIDDFKDNFYHGDYLNMLSPEAIANTKVKHMDFIQKKYNCDRKKMILFDDNKLNIEKTKNAGYSTILANNNIYGGLSNTVDNEILQYF